MLINTTENLPEIRTNPKLIANCYPKIRVGPLTGTLGVTCTVSRLAKQFSRAVGSSAPSLPSLSSSAEPRKIYAAFPDRQKKNIPI